MELHYQVYFVTMLIIHVIYGLVFLGIVLSVPSYIYALNMFVQILLCLFLMFRYRPFRNNYTFKRADANLIFGASTLLLFNIVSLPILYSFITSAKSNFKKQTA